MPIINDHIRALKCESPLVRQVATLTLGEINGPRSFETLSYQPSNDETEALRKTAAEPLEKLVKSQTISLPV